MPYAALSTFGPINLEQSSQFDVPERKDLVGVLLETLTVVDNALRERIEILDLFRPCIREDLLESVVVLVLLFTFEVTITAKLHENLVICHRSSVPLPGQILHCVLLRWNWKRTWSLHLVEVLIHALSTTRTLSSSQLIRAYWELGINLVAVGQRSQTTRN